MNPGAPAGWFGRVLRAVALVLVVAAGARVAAELLAPLVPWLLVVGLLGVIYAVLFRGWRR